MAQNNNKNKRLISLFFLGCLLFNYPLLSLFNVKTFYLGIPLLCLYLFSVWFALVLLICLATRRPTDVMRTPANKYPGSRIRN
jgi:hypothetical protein